MRAWVRTRSFRIVFVIALVEVACLNLFLMRLNHGLREAHSAVEKEKATLKEVRQKAESLPAQQREYQRLRQRLALLEEKRPPEEFIPTFLQQFSLACQMLDLRIKNFQPRIPKEPAGGSPPSGASPAALTSQEPKEWEVEAVVEGPYRSHVALLKVLQQFPKAVAVDVLSLRSLGEEGEDRLEMNLLLVAYPIGRPREEEHEKAQPVATTGPSGGGTPLTGLAPGGPLEGVPSLPAAPTSPNTGGD